MATHNGQKSSGEQSAKDLVGAYLLGSWRLAVADQVVAGRGRWHEPRVAS